MSADDDDRRSPETALVPARIINEHVYCPRLAWLEWEAKAFSHNAETAEGSDAHRRVDQQRGQLPANSETWEAATSVTMSSTRLGVISKLDKVELSDGVAVPVETKRGKPKDDAVAVWDPELAQLSAQVLLLREHGYDVPHAEVFFAAARGRRIVPVPDDAKAWIKGLVGEIRANAGRPTPPPPLVDSPKCPRCALVGVCLPDETNLLGEQGGTHVRKLVAGDAPSRPLYATKPGSFIRKKSKRLLLEHEGEQEASRRLIDISHLAIFGNVTVSAAAMRACLEGDIAILWFSHGGWFSGYSIPHGGSWVARRQGQYALAADPDASSSVARAFIGGKIRNQRTLLRRHGGGEAERSLGPLAELARQSDCCPTIPTLLGLEGAAARLYFQKFTSMLASQAEEYSFETRNRRPPLDPVNALLSFAYALLLRDTTVAALAAGLDPQVGFLHQPRFGRPSLGLDLAEEFRPLLADSAVIMAINNGEIGEQSFVRRGGAVALTAKGRRAFIDAYERRIAVEITHPLFGYKTSYRRAIELQARQLAAVLDGQLERYQPLTTR